MLAEDEERGGIESGGGEIPDAKNTLKPEELHWVEAILPTLVVGVAVIGALVKVLPDAPSINADDEIRPRDVGEKTGIPSSIMSQCPPGTNVLQPSEPGTRKCH